MIGFESTTTTSAAMNDDDYVSDDSRGMDKGKRETAAAAATKRNRRQKKKADAATKTKTTKGKRKGKGKGKGKRGGIAKSLKTIRDKINCSSCGNQMTQSKNLNYVEIPNKKIPKGSNGEPMYKSLTGGADKVMGILCDDCLKMKESGTAYISLKTVVVEKRDGTITNIPITNIPDSGTK